MMPLKAKGVFIMIVRVVTTGCLAAAIYAATPVPSSNAADSVINIQLQDTTTSSDIKDMKMVLDRNTASAGKVTLRAKNESKQLIHEVIVFRDTGEPMPYNESSGRLVEKQMKSLGEVSDLKPGASGQKTFDLTPGTYLLICNQALHLKNGMFARLTIVASAAGASAAVDSASAKNMQAPPATKDIVEDPKAKGKADDGS